MFWTQKNSLVNDLFTPQPWFPKKIAGQDFFPQMFAHLIKRLAQLV